jgi:hypothetical protein
MSGDHNKYYKRNLRDEIEEGLDNIPLITVSKLQENEDGSCDLEVTTNPEATRRLVDIGLNALLEKALDKDNDEYTVA